MRYLIKRKGRTIDYAPIPKRAKILRRDGGYRIKIGKRLGVVFRGYHLINAKSVSSAIKRIMR